MRTSAVPYTVGHHRRCKTLHQLQIAIYVAFELGADDVDLGEHIGARQLVGHSSILLIDKDSADRKHKNSDRRRQIGGRKDGLPDAADIEARPGHSTRIAVRTEVHRLNIEETA